MFLERYPVEKPTEAEIAELKARAAAYYAADKEFYAAQAKRFQEYNARQAAKEKRDDGSIDWDYEECGSYRNSDWGA